MELPQPSPAERPRFDTQNILWFFGAFVATASSDAVVSRVHPSARGAWILLAALVFLAAFAALAAALIRLGFAVPGGVLAAMAVTFVPVVAGAAEKLAGVLPSASVDALQDFQGWLLLVTLATAGAGLAAFAAVRFPFVLSIVAAAAFASGQLLVPAFVDRPSAAAHATAFVVVGTAMLAVGIALDLQGARRAAFWFHLDGLLGLAAGLAYHAFRHASWGWILIFVAGALLLLLAASLGRATWAAFGVAGLFVPAAHYLDVWLGTLGTAFALAALGAGLVALGLAVQVLRRPLAAARPS